MDYSGKKFKISVSEYDYSDLVIERSILEPICVEVIGLQHKAGKCLAELIPDADLILQKYIKILMNGYAVVQDVYEIGVASVATSLFIHTDLLSAFSILGLCNRIIKPVQIISEKLIRTAWEISCLFGGVFKIIFITFASPDDKREINENIITRELRIKGGLA